MAEAAEGSLPHVFSGCEDSAPPPSLAETRTTTTTLIARTRARREAAAPAVGALWRRQRKRIIISLPFLLSPSHDLDPAVMPDVSAPCLACLLLASRRRWIKKGQMDAGKKPASDAPPTTACRRIKLTPSPKEDFVEDWWVARLAETRTMLMVVQNSP
jgi:hypothetical protein